ncbi:MAG: hypothetical protein LBU34_15670 [Planctomycetaceae bacterium]|nr:hypothetical protein [Planctomycetaceae bacterium]
MKILESIHEIEAILDPHQCPNCKHINGLNAEYSDCFRLVECGVMNGKPYQVVEVVTTTCQKCGTTYNIKNYV